MAKVTFDGTNKHINVIAGEDSLIVEDDVYSEWKRWIVLSDNAKYDQAFRTFGGDPTVAGQFAPKYFFLLNGWRIRIDGNTNPNVDVAINLYVDGGGNPFVLLNSANVSNLRSDVGVVESELQDILDYAGVIVYDAIDGQAGTTHPTGTSAYPVNNSADLQALMDLYDINKVLLQSNMVVTQDFNNVLFETNTAAEFLNPDGNKMDQCFFFRMNVSGNFDGSSIVVQDCSIGDVQGVYGVASNCHLSGNILLEPYQQFIMSDCASGIAGTGSPVIDMNSGSPTDLSVRNYSGGLRIINCDHPDDVGTVEYVAGKCHVGIDEDDDGGCTDGYLSIRGVVKISDWSSGTEIDTSAAFETSNTYQGHIHVGHGVDSVAGSDYPIGTSRRPVNNWADAKLIMEKYHIHNVLLHTNSQLTESIPNTKIESIAGNVFLDVNGQDVSNTRFEGIGIYGDFADSQVVIDKSYLVSAYRIHGLIRDTQLGGLIQGSTGIQL